MNRVWKSAAWAMALALALSMSATTLAAQSQGQPPPPPPKPGEPKPADPAAPGVAPGPPAAPAVNPEELAAFQEVEGTGDSQVIIEKGEEFLKKFPESRYREAVFARLTNGYYNAGQVDKMVISGEKALELNPNNINVLVVLGSSILRGKFRTSDLDAEQKLMKAESYCKKAIDLLTKMEKPVNVTEEDFLRIKNQGLAMSHGGLGLAYLHRGRAADAAAELEQSTSIVPDPDATDYYLLGLVYKALKRPADAAVAYGHCAEVAGPLQNTCKSEQDAAKKTAEAAPKP